MPCGVLPIGVRLQSGHVRDGPGCINEDQRSGIDRWLRSVTHIAVRLDIRMVLLAAVQRLF
jgi:hypothetical protein